MLAEPYPREYDIMAISGATEGEPDREPDYTDMFEGHAEGEAYDHDDLYEQYSDQSEEELRPLKMPVVDSPTEAPTTDFFQGAVDQTDKAELEAEDSRPSPTMGRSPEEQVYRSPTEEHPEDRPFESPLQEELVEDERARSPSPQHVPETTEEAEVQQVAVSGILAEMQEMEKYTTEEESGDELEDGLEQYEKETEEDYVATSEQTVTQDLQTQVLVSEQFSEVQQEMYHKESVTYSETTYTAEHVAMEELVILEDQYEASQHEEEKETDSVEAEQFVDRKELFAMEERDVSVQDKDTADMKEEAEDEREEESPTDMYVDRTERFLEEPVEILTADGEPTDKSSVLETTGTVGAVNGISQPPVIGDRQLSAQSSISGPDNFYQDFGVDYHLSIHPPLYPSSSTEVQDRSGTPSDADSGEAAQNGFAAVGITGSYTSEITSGSQSFLSESTVSRMSESDYTSRSETWAASECTMTGSEFEPEGRITVDTSEQIFIEQKIEDSHSEHEETQIQMDTLDRPMSPSEYTLVTSHDHDRMMQALDIQPEEDRSPEEGEEEREDEIERDSLQSEESDEVMSDDEQGSERPPSPTEYTLIASQDQ